GARRLIDQFGIRSEPGNGTVVELGHAFPRRLPRITQARLADIAAAIKRAGPEDPLAALRDQNRDLMQSLDENWRLREESGQLSQELNDTNRGVVALYAELE